MSRVVIIATAVVLASVTLTAWQQPQAVRPVPSRPLAVQEPPPEASLAAMEQHHAAAIDAGSRIAAAYHELDHAAAEVAARARACCTAGGGSAAEGDVRSEQLLHAVEELQKLQEALGSEVLALQNRMQHESHRYQTMSNVLKVAHDTEMAAVRNVR